MRVIAGNAKGRRLKTSRGLALRPTADKVKGAVFNILTSRFIIESAQLLDLFAGSGALGIEALSRGAATVIFVEESSSAVRVLRDNLRHCGFERQARVMHMPVQRALDQLARAGVRVDGVLADPPYARDLVEGTLRALAGGGLLHQGAWVVIEHRIDEPPQAAHGLLRLTQARRYGKTGVALFEVNDAMPEGQKTPDKLRRAVYAGSFDPITNGHLDVVRRALAVFDEVIVSVATNTSDPAKDHATFSVAERVAMIQEALADTGGRARADSFSGLLVDYCERIGAAVIIRGLRAVSDFEYEFQMAMMNRHLKPHVETVFLTAGETHFYTASRLVKEVASLGGEVRGLVPDTVYRRLLKKVRPER
jgi:pantetheine-phosphate adenylyltransferase/16S rRNA (guanine(966)-N(2))-methyltransferase RsmD